MASNMRTRMSTVHPSAVTPLGVQSSRFDTSIQYHGLDGLNKVSLLYLLQVLLACKSGL